ncbi:unnamed protein product [Cyclocybe aegerita]|uniref:Uncharacterized protein n=1 Tax=Cyclocybe aegerita TaxID=1973307 RepID=A0A8S0VX85_CYCAE|nr:unnamed protein product [Cyclocybe aegerita]
MSPSEDAPENGQQQVVYQDSVRVSKDAAARSAPAAQHEDAVPHASRGGRSEQEHHTQRNEDKRRDTKTGSRGSHENRGREDRDKMRGASDHIPTPVVPPKAPPSTTVTSTATAYDQHKRELTDLNRPPSRQESRRSESPSDEEFVHVECDSARPDVRPRATSVTGRGTGAYSGSSPTSRNHRSSDSRSTMPVSYASAVTSHAPQAISPGSHHTQYKTLAPSSTVTHETQTSVYPRRGSIDREVTAEEFHQHIPRETFQESPRPHSDPGEANLKEDRGPTHQSQQELQQDVDAPRSASAPSGNLFSAGIRSIFSGSIGPIVEAEMNRMKEKVRLAEAKASKYRNTLEGYQAELYRSQGEVRTYARTCRELQHDRQRLMETNTSLMHELNAVNRRLEETKALSDTRGKELIGAQAFLTKADSLSISDVVQKVEGLNEEIFQAAASLGECITRRKYGLTEVQLGECFQRVSSLIGAPLASIIVEESHKSEEEPANPLLVQVVLQVFLANFCVRKIRAWTPDDATINTFLKQTYEGIRDNEEQAVSGRWRALTRKSLFTNSEVWVHEVAERLSTVFQLCGWNATQAHREAFENQLIPIFKGVHDARSALGEMFTSADLEASTIQPGVPFKREYMEEVYGDGDDHKSGTQAVVATTGIGVRKALPRERRYENVMSPKVILESSLKVALEPQPQEASRRSKGRRDKRPRDEQQDDRQRSKVPAFSHEK